MGRWEPGSRGRLQEAALSLYAEHGFEQTTAAQVAARAGVTERTFFRHFPDKREVLFGGSEHVRDRLVAAVAAAPPDLSPLEAVALGVLAAAELIGAQPRERARQRQQVIAAHGALRERELAKLADWSAEVTAVLCARGVAAPRAALAAEAGASVLRVGVLAWTAPGERRTLVEVVRATVADLQALSAPA